jgi:hypothetical protein
MPVCNRCKKYSDCLTIDQCDHCGARDWDESTVVRGSPEAARQKMKAPLLTATQNTVRAASQNVATNAKDGVQGLGCLLILGAIAAAIWFVLLPDGWTAPYTYAAKYHVDSSKVQFTAKPKDCDFIHAPIGDKGCHCKKIVMVYNENGAVVDGDFALKFGVDTSGHQIVSQDHGENVAAT